MVRVFQFTGLSMNKREQYIVIPFVFREDNFTLQRFAVKDYKVRVQYITRFVFARAMRIDCNFPCTTCNHRQLRIVKGKILIRLFAFLVWRIGVLDSNSKAAFSVFVNVNVTLLHFLDMGQSHFSKVWAILVYCVTHHENFDVVTVTDNS